MKTTDRQLFPTMNKATLEGIVSDLSKAEQLMYVHESDSVLQLLSEMRQAIVFDNYEAWLQFREDIKPAVESLREANRKSAEED